jgi:argininosuccinate lyase
MTGMVGDMKIDKDAMAAAAGAGYSTATDLADWLVRTLDMPFRQAHHVTGEIVALAEKAGVTLSEVPLSDMQKCEPGIREDVFSVLSVENSVASRISFGGTAPSNVRNMAQGWIKRLESSPGSG